jgi:hypothetical protein
MHCMSFDGQTLLIGPENLTHPALERQAGGVLDGKSDCVGVEEYNDGVLLVVVIGELEIDV